MKDKELLDFCRVKKIFDKGFGFLTSLYYDEPVFFHFNKVKDPSAKEKLEKLKRGEVYFYYTSIIHNDKRRVYKLWLDVNDIDKNLIPDFIERIIEELNDGKINMFEIAHVVKKLRENDLLDKIKLRDILESKKMLKAPSLLKAVLLESEVKENDFFDKLIADIESNKIDSGSWTDAVLNKIYS